MSHNSDDSYKLFSIISVAMFVVWMVVMGFVTGLVGLIYDILPRSITLSMILLGTPFYALKVTAMSLILTFCTWATFKGCDGWWATFGTVMSILFGTGLFFFIFFVAPFNPPALEELGINPLLSTVPGTAVASAIAATLLKIPFVRDWIFS